MSEAVDVCRRAFDAWNRRDLDAVVDCYDPDATIVLPQEWPDADTVRGREAIRRFYAGFEDTWREGTEVMPQAFHRRGDRVAVPVMSSGTARGAGLGLDFDYTMIFTVADGAITQVEFHFGHDSAAAFSSDDEQQ